MVLPPQLTNPQENDNFASVASNFEAPTLAQEPQYNPDTGAFDVAINFKNPLETPISVESFSADLKSSVNGLDLGTIALTSPIHIDPAENGVIDVSGVLNQDTINQLQAQFGENGRLNVVVENVDAVVAGVHLHLDRFDVGQIDLGSLQNAVGGT
jgi:hypothetical protein